jgi:hypothetical protein
MDRIPPQFAAVIVYVVTPKILPELANGWVPCLLAFTTFMMLQRFQQAGAAQKTEAICGGDAPDFPVSMKDDGGDTMSMTLSKIRTNIPTVVDFYQNF